ncbi:MAG: PQQ-binding-like beta-propeller repeat protein [Planctomycetaceae bacterium]|nr:PQQ-binding-like beta-propeller repeat protein [Planctomycetaceae bacterium]
MKTLAVLLPAFLYVCTATAGDAPRDLTRHLGQTPALVVLAGGEDETCLANVKAIVAETPWMILCRGKASPAMDELREWARQEGLLGGRVSVLADDRPSLWLAEDMADAVWVSPGTGSPPSEEEMLRVLRPGGVAIVAGRTIVKPAQAGTDDWRHPYHSPSNNIVSQDSLARLPGELRFQTFPVFAAMPNQSLFAGGRIYFFSGHIAFHRREEPTLNRLTVLNAYNGLTLWNRPLNPDYVVHNVAKLATGNEVLFAEGATLWLLDGATGNERGKFAPPAEAVQAGGTDWKWIAREGNTLWAAFGPPDAHVAPHKARREMGHWPWDVANTQYEPIVQNFGKATTLAAFEFPEMKLRWQVTEQEPFDARALCMDRGRILQLAPRHYMVALDAETGKTVWRREPGTSQKLFDTIGDALKRQGWGIGWATYCYARAGDGVVVLAGPQFKTTIGLSFENGDLLWSSPIQSPHPFFTGDQLYVMPRVASPTAVCQKVDPLTGKVLDQFNLGVIGSCTRVTVTPSQFFYRPGGGEGRTVYVDLAEQKLAAYEGVVRPGCFDGVVPANGRLYWMPLACDCWQVHGTFCMAPRKKLAGRVPAELDAWDQPSSSTPAAKGDWPMYRANSAGTAKIAVKIPRNATERWRKRLPSDGLSAPVCAGGRVFVAAVDGSVTSLNVADGKMVWQASSEAAVTHPPAYWNGRVVFGSCDGCLYCVDAADGRELGRLELAPERRFVNIMNRLMSTWPLGGGVVISDDGVAYTAAGSTAADGCVAAAVDLTTGKLRWQHSFTLDQPQPNLSFGVQSNLLLKNGKLLINGGAPVGIVALDAATGTPPQVVTKLEAGMEMFVEPDGRLSCLGPELFSQGRTRTTIFKRHQGRIYFPLLDRHVALIDGRLFCSRDMAALDRIVEWMNKIQNMVPRNVMTVPTDETILWSGDTSDVRGLAVATDGLVVLHEDGVEGLSADGEILWTVPLPSPPVRWGVALTGAGIVVTLTDGQVVCLGSE